MFLPFDVTDALPQELAAQIDGHTALDGLSAHDLRELHILSRPGGLVLLGRESLVAPLRVLDEDPARRATLEHHASGYLLVLSQGAVGESRYRVPSYQLDLVRALLPRFTSPAPSVDDAASPRGPDTLERVARPEARVTPATAQEAQLPLADEPEEQETGPAPSAAVGAVPADVAAPGARIRPPADVGAAASLVQDIEERCAEAILAEAFGRAKRHLTALNDEGAVGARRRALETIGETLACIAAGSLEDAFWPLIEWRYHAPKTHAAKLYEACLGLIGRRFEQAREPHLAVMCYRQIEHPPWGHLLREIMHIHSLTARKTRKRFAAARIQALRAYTRRHPRCAEAWAHLAARVAPADPAEARQLLALALALDPRCAGAWGLKLDGLRKAASVEYPGARTDEIAAERQSLLRNLADPLDCADETALAVVAEHALYDRRFQLSLDAMRGLLALRRKPAERRALQETMDAIRWLQGKQWLHAATWRTCAYANDGEPAPAGPASSAATGS